MAEERPHDGRCVAVATALKSTGTIARLKREKLNGDSHLAD
jgi:hypothetical protein